MPSVACARQSRAHYRGVQRPHRFLPLAGVGAGVGVGRRPAGSMGALVAGTPRWRADAPSCLRGAVPRALPRSSMTTSLPSSCRSRGRGRGRAARSRLDGNARGWNSSVARGCPQLLARGSPARTTEEFNDHIASFLLPESGPESGSGSGGAQPARWERSWLELLGGARMPPVACAGQSRAHYRGVP